MHRVELKGHNGNCDELFKMVPNAPCGVESLDHKWEVENMVGVPNAPCGVESNLFHIVHFFSHPAVPNAPCGVESQSFAVLPQASFQGLFLMHRVELKAFSVTSYNAMIVRS